MRKYCLALDLKNDPALISAYEHWHKKENNWPEINKSITDAGIIDMEIYRVENRLFMIMETDDSFDFSRKAKMDATNPKVQEWEALMNTFQQVIPGTKPGEKWRLMERIFKL